MAPAAPTSVGLVLGAGGTPGYHWDVGVLDALCAVSGWDARTADVVVGTSAGSLVGASLRAGISAADLAAAAAGEPLSPEGEALFAAGGPAAPLAPFRRAGRARPADVRGAARALRTPWRTRPGVVGAALIPAGGVDMSPVGSRQRRLHGEAWPAAPFYAVAARLDDGARVAFGAPGAPRTDVATAVSASCAVPGYARPVEVGGRRYVDGGAWSSTNADLLLGHGLDLVVVLVPMGIGRAVRRRHPDALLRRYLARQTGAEARRLRRGGTRVAVIAPTEADLAVLSLAVGGGVGPDIVAAARASTRARLAADATLARALAAAAPHAR